MLLSTCFLETGELLPQVPRGMPLQEISNQRRTKAWRRTHNDMDMIDVRFQCQERQPMPLTAFSNQAFRCCLHLPGEYLSAILRYPDEMIGYRVVGVSGFTHLQTTLIHGIMIP